MFCILDKLIKFSINFYLFPESLLDHRNLTLYTLYLIIHPSVVFKLRVYILLLRNSDDLILYMFSCAVNRS